MWSAQAKAEGLTLLVAETKVGYYGVYHQPGKPKPYVARVRRGGKMVYLGCYVTAEEAALSVARSPEGRKAAAERPEAVPPLTSEGARQQAQAEGLTLRVAKNKTGYSGVNHQPDRTIPYQARVTRGGKDMSLGYFGTAEEAALCVARSPEGQAAAERAAASAAAAPPAPPLTSEEARQQAQAEGLTLLVAENRSGYFGVSNKPGQPKPYQAQLRRLGKKVSLGSFATAEEAALCVARSPEGRKAAAAAERAAASEEGQGTGPTMLSAEILKEEGAVPPMPLGAFVKEEEVAQPMPPGACFKEEGVVPSMPPDTIVKREQEVVVKEEERSEDATKRRRSK